MIVDPEKSDARSSFRKVQSLRNTIDVVLFAKACCGGDLEVVQRLKSSSNKFLNRNCDFDSQETSLKGYIDSADALQSRVRNAIDLVRAINATVRVTY